MLNRKGKGGEWAGGRRKDRPGSKPLCCSDRDYERLRGEDAQKGRYIFKFAAGMPIHPESGKKQVLTPGSWVRARASKFRGRCRATAIRTARTTLP